MDSHLSLIGCAVIGGVFLLSLLGFQADLRDYSFNNTNEVIVQQNALALTEMLESDFQQIGLGADSLMVTSAGVKSISYYADLNADGTAELVTYTLSNSSTATETPNPRDGVLYRSVNGATQVNAAMGVTDFKLRYFDRDGVLTNDTAQIRTIEMTLQMESTVPYHGKYAQFLWRKKITPPNLLRS